MKDKRLHTLAENHMSTKFCCGLSLKVVYVTISLSLIQHMLQIFYGIGSALSVYARYAYNFR
jgi:hypothetical protein